MSHLRDPVVAELRAEANDAQLPSREHQLVVTLVTSPCSPINAISIPARAHLGNLRVAKRIVTSV